MAAVVARTGRTRPIGPRRARGRRRRADAEPVGLGPPGDAGMVSWRRVVAGLRSVGGDWRATCGHRAIGGGTCLVPATARGTPDDRVAARAPSSRGELDHPSRSDPASPDEDAAVSCSASRDAGCTTVVWTGFGTGAAVLRTGLTAAGEDVLMVFGSTAMKDGRTSTWRAAARARSSRARASISRARRTRRRNASSTTTSRSTRCLRVCSRAEGWDAGGTVAARDALRRGRPATRCSSADLRVDGSRAWRPRTGRRQTARCRRTRRSILPSRSRAVGAAGHGQTRRGGRCRCARPGCCRWGRAGPGRRTRTATPRPAHRVRRGVRAAIARRLGLALGWTRTACEAGTAPVGRRTRRRPAVSGGRAGAGHAGLAGLLQHAGRRSSCRPRSPAPTTRSRRPGPATS